MKWCKDCGRELFSMEAVCDECGSTAISTMPVPQRGRIEQGVREFQAFEDSIRALLDLAAALSVRELQLALARLADRKVSHRGLDAADPKGIVLAAYLGLRERGIKSESLLSRARWGAKCGFIMGGHQLGRRLIQEIDEFRLRTPPTPLEGWAEPLLNDKIRTLAP